MQNLSDSEIRQAVRKSYGNLAKAGDAGCCSPTACCGSENKPTPKDISVALGYSKDDVSTIPQGANLGLGCGNPQAIASLQPGETVLDLGSGGGFDCFLAAKAVGQSGRVIGVDMTPEMIQKARKNAATADLSNVEFRLGEIENLPVADNSIDIIMSNCVINLSPEKNKVFQDAFRVLKPGGRLAIFDIVATAPLSDEVKNDLALHAGCIAGAVRIEELKSTLKEAGFTHIQITPVEESKKIIREWAKGKTFEDFLVSASIEAVK